MIAPSPMKQPSQESEYDAALRSPMWRLKRMDILQRDEHKCRNCGQTQGLQIHHKCYLYSSEKKRHVRIWNYPNRMLVTLCKDCHERAHQQYKIPNYNL